MTTKLTDLPAYVDLGEPAFHKYLEYLGPNVDNVSGKSNKFWEVAVFKRDGRHVVVTRWGKFGAKGQTKEKVHYGLYDAEASARQQARKKRDKGYTREVDVITRLGATLDG